MPFKIPNSWVWTTLGKVSNFERGITFPSSAKQYKKTIENIACIRTANVQEKLKINDLWYVNREYMNNNPNKVLQIGDIIMSSANSRELVGKTAIYNVTGQQMTFGGFVMVIRGVLLDIDYLHIMLRWNFLSGAFALKSTQTTNIANLNTVILDAVSLPLPPLTEQNRIANKVHNIFNNLIVLEESLQ